MKKSVFILAVSMLITGALFTGCKSSADKVQDAKDNVVAASQALDQAVKDSIQQFRNESEATISNYEATIAEFKVKIANASKENKAKYENMLADIEQKNLEMKKKLEEFKEDGIDQWKSFRNEFKHDIDELGRSLKDFTVKNK